MAHDLIVVGAPTHAFALSRPSTRQDAVRQGAATGRDGAGLREWLGDLVPVDPGTPHLAAVFDTRVSKVGHLPKSAATGAARLLRHHGYTLVDKPVGFLVEDIKGALVAGEVERATEWGRQIALRTQSRLVGSEGTGATP